MNTLTLTYDQVFKVHEACIPPNAKGYSVIRDELIDASINWYEIDDYFRSDVAVAITKF